MKRMFLILKRAWTVDEIDANGCPGTYTIPIGRHEVERIESPIGEKDTPWLVLKGRETKIGKAEEFWRQWKEFKWGDYQVVIEEK